MITEGDSAANFAVKGIEDGGYTGSMPIKGKLLNVGTCDIKQYAENVEIAMLK
jgi:DNA gyrase/topoisomerase IV subunit B